MLAVTRHRVPVADGDRFLDTARDALAALSARPGFVRGSIGRAVDEPALWLVSTQWADIGSYRRALSDHDVKVRAVPLLSTAVDEPTAYEVLVSDGAGSQAAGEGGVAALSARAADADTAAPGRA